MTYCIGDIFLWVISFKVICNKSILAKNNYIKDTYIGITVNKNKFINNAYSEDTNSVDAIKHLKM